MRSVQLLDEVEPSILFKDYDYLTSASAPLVRHFQEMGKYLVSRFVASPQDLVVEIGGNDGILLEAIKDQATILNVEPATNVAKLSSERGVLTINEFFSAETAKKIVEKNGIAKLVVANNVMAHIPGIKDVFEGIKILIGEQGVFVMEVHWVGNLIGDGGFDQIYHEHLFYYSLHALRALVRQFGLDVFDIETVPIHGESMRVLSQEPPLEEHVSAFLKREEDLGLTALDAFLVFAEKVTKNKAELKELLMGFKNEGKKSRGMGLLQKGIHC